MAGKQAADAIGFRAVQGVPLSDLAPKDFAYPIATWTTSQFLTARAVARHMVKTWAANGSVNRRLGRRSTERGTEGTNDEGHPKEGDKSDDEAHNRDT